MVRLYRLGACSGKRSYPARSSVVEHGSHQVTNGEDPDNLPGIDDRQVTEAAVNHEDCRVLGGVVRLDRLGPSRHPVADDRLGGETVGDRAEDVAFGEHTHESISVEDEDSPDAAVVHAAYRILDRHVWLDGEQVSRHDVRDVLHQGSVGRNAPTSK